MNFNAKSLSISRYRLFRSEITFDSEMEEPFLLIDCFPELKHMVNVRRSHSFQEAHRISKTCIVVFRSLAKISNEWNAISRFTEKLEAS